MKKTFNENKNYYALLGVSETASKDTLDKVIGDIARNSFNGQKLSNFQEDMLAELWEAYNVLSDSTTRKEYDLARKKKTKNNKTTETKTPVENASVKENKPQTEDIEQKDIAEFANTIANNLTQTFEDEYECDEENDLEDDNNPTEEDLDEELGSYEEENNSRKKVETVEEVDDEEKESILAKAKNIIFRKSTAGLALLIIATALTLRSCNKAKNIKTENRDIQTKSAAVDDTNEVVVEPTSTPEITPTPTPEIDKVNDENYMQEKADNLWNKVASSNNSKSSLPDTNACYELIKWAHHSNPNYTGTYTISNDYAYSILTDLYMDNIDISSIFEGLDSQEALANIQSIKQNLNANNNTYEDEYQALTTLVDSANMIKGETYNDYTATMAFAVYANEIVSLPNITDARTTDTTYNEKFNKVYYPSGQAILANLVDGAYDEDDAVKLSR